MHHTTHFIQDENHLAECILKETISNVEIKAALHHVADKVILTILNPIATAVLNPSVKSVADLNEPYLKSVLKLAEQNIDAERPFGAVLQGFKTPDDILCSKKNIGDLLDAFRSCLSNIDSVSNIESVLKVLKTIADLSFCYVEYLHELHHENFENIKNMIWLTPEEMDVRILRSELGSEDKLAVTYGLGTEDGVDLVPAKNNVGMNSAKSLFAGASMAWRLNIILKKFDAAVVARSALLAEYAKAQEADCDTTIIQEKLAKVDKNEYLPALAKMKFYGIPLEASERKSLDEYAMRYKTTFEKLATLPNQTTPPFVMYPLIANISRSTARTLIALQDIGAFWLKDSSFNVTHAQIVANTCAGFYIFGGNHSFIEVAEIYNRLLDYVAISHPEKLAGGVLRGEPLNEPYMHLKDAVEKKLPYFQIGNYQSFLHSSFTEKINISTNEDDIGSYYKKKFM